MLILSSQCMAADLPVGLGDMMKKMKGVAEHAKQKPANPPESTQPDQQAESTSATEPPTQTSESSTGNLPLSAEEYCNKLKNDPTVIKISQLKKQAIDLNVSSQDVNGALNSMQSRLQEWIETTIPSLGPNGASKLDGRIVSKVYKNRQVLLTRAQICSQSMTDSDLKYFLAKDVPYKQTSAWSTKVADIIVMFFNGGQDQLASASSDYLTKLDGAINDAKIALESKKKEEEHAKEVQKKNEELAAKEEEKRVAEMAAEQKAKDDKKQKLKEKYLK